MVKGFEYLFNRATCLWETLVFNFVCRQLITRLKFGDLKELIICYIDKGHADVAYSVIGCIRVIAIFFKATVSASNWALIV